MTLQPNYFRDKDGKLQPISLLESELIEDHITYLDHETNKWHCLKRGTLESWLAGGKQLVKGIWTEGETKEQSLLKMWNDIHKFNTTTPRVYGGNNILGRAGM